MRTIPHPLAVLSFAPAFATAATAQGVHVGGWVFEGHTAQGSGPLPGPFNGKKQ